ncbi:hypothetical protein [Dactylosporangium sp. NPDC051484]|uniref:hypothetical protein n=1 Tax=Dactylosporangium sp. NPDC051484 TaxID=3154942 RepID=UPI00344C1C4C
MTPPFELVAVDRAAAEGLVPILRDAEEGDERIRGARGRCARRRGRRALSGRPSTRTASPCWT